MKRNRKIKKYASYVRLSVDFEEENTLEEIIEFVKPLMYELENIMRVKGYIKVGKLKFQPTDKIVNKLQIHAIWGRFIYVGKRKAKKRDII